MNHKSTESRIHRVIAQIRIFSTDTNSSQNFPEKLARLGSFCRVYCTHRGSNRVLEVLDHAGFSLISLLTVHTHRTGVCIQPSTWSWFEIESFPCTVSSDSNFNSDVAMPPVRGACFVVAGGESSWSSGRHWARNICVGRSRHFHMLVFMFIFMLEDDYLLTCILYGLWSPCTEYSNLFKGLVTWSNSTFGSRVLADDWQYVSLCMEYCIFWWLVWNELEEVTGWDQVIV